MTLSPFDNQRDEELGRLLREQLSGSEPEAFLARMRLAVGEAERPTEWDVLAGWARPRTMAFAIAAALLLWLGTRFQGQGVPVDPGIAGSLSSSAVVSAQPPEVDEIMVALRERP